MNKVLSPAQVAALLAGSVHAAESAENSAAAGSPVNDLPIRLYDFAHPEPLPSNRVESLQRLLALTSDRVQVELTRLLRTHVAVRFLSMEQSTYRDCLVASEAPTCLVQLQSAGGAEPWLVEISRPLSFGMMECLLGGQPSPSTSVPDRAFTNVETRLIEKSVRAVLRCLPAELADVDTFVVKQVISDGQLIEQATSNEAVVLVNLEIAIGPLQGLMQLCLPANVVSVEFSVRQDADSSPDRVRFLAGQIPVVATATVARMKRTAGEVAAWETGDVFLTDVAADAEIRLDVGGQEIARAKVLPDHPQQALVVTSTEPSRPG